MATRARRITIEVGGEDVGAGRALRGAGDDLDRLGQKLRGVDRDAKRGFDGVEREADKLGQKLKAAGQDGGNKLTDGIRSGVSGLGSAVESAGSTAADAISSGFDVGTIADTLSGVLESVGGRIGPAAAGLGLVVGGAIAVGVMNGMETEATTDRLAAQLGGSEWAQDMGEVAGDLYLQGFGQSVGDAAAAVRGVLEAGILPEDATNAQIERMTGQVLTFADVLEQDLGESTTAVAQMIRTGLARDGTHALDLLTRGVQQGGDQFGDFVGTVAEGSGTFSQFGLTGEQAISGTLQALDAGARSGDFFVGILEELAGNAGDSVEVFDELGLAGEDMARRLTAGGPDASAALGELFQALRDIEDPAARANAAVALFGEEGVANLQAILAIDLSPMGNRLGETAGAADRLGSAYDNASSRIETFRRQALEQLTVFIAEYVLPVVERFSNWAKENPATFAILAAVIGGALVGALVAYTVASIGATLATLGWSWWILLIAAVIAGFVAGLIWAYQNVDWFRAAVDRVADVFQNVLWPILTRVGGFVGDNLPRAIGFARQAWDRFSYVGGLVADILSRLYDRGRYVADLAGGWLSRGAEIAGGAWDRLWGVLSGVWDILSDIVSIAGRAADAISNIPGGGIISGIGGFLGFDVGGVVPGPTGAPVLAVVHGGETIVPTHNPAAMRSLTNDFDARSFAGSSGGGGGGDTYVSISLAGAIVASAADAERWVSEAWNRAAAKGKVNVRGKRL